MRLNSARIWCSTVALLFGGLLLACNVPTANADDDTIWVASSNVTNQFPVGFRFTIEAMSVNEIESITVRLQIGQDTRVAAGSMFLDHGISVRGQMLWRTDVPGRYIPPGTVISYYFEIEDSEDGRLQSEPQEFIYHDTRFEWEEFSEGPVTIAYHGPVRRRAEQVLGTIGETLAKMGPILGEYTGEPIRVTMYNNAVEMLEALPPENRRSGLATEGQASARFGTILVMGGTGGALATAAHEITHILVHRAGDSIFRRVPLWLNEGLAEYANDDPDSQYDDALEFAIGADRLLSSFLNNYPEKPGDIIIFYGQARSIVRYIIDRYGADKMKALMSTLKGGKSISAAVEEVYGLSLEELDGLWRDSVAAPPYVPPLSAHGRPTPVPLRPILPYSLTPQPQTVHIGNVSKSPEPTPTPEPEPTATPSPTPEPAPTATPTPSPTDTPISAARSAAESATSEDQASASTPAAGAVTSPVSPPERPAPVSSSCNARLDHSNGPLDLSMAGLLFGLAGLRLRGRLHRRSAPRRRRDFRPSA